MPNPGLREMDVALVVDQVRVAVPPDVTEDGEAEKVIVGLGRTGAVVVNVLLLERAKFPAASLDLTR